MRSLIRTLPLTLASAAFLLPFLSPTSALAAGDVTAPSCPNEAMVGYSANLPDCRAYEQVSPVKKDGGSGGALVFGGFLQENKKLPFQSVGNGSAVVYPGEPSFMVPPRDEEIEEFAQYTSVRSSDAWSTTVGDTLTPETVPTVILPSVSEGSNPQVLEETPDGSKVFFLDEKHGPGITPDSNAAENEPDLYEYTVPSSAHPAGELVDLTVDTNIKGGKPEHADVRGILGVGGEGAEEGSYVYFVAGGILAPEASEGGCTLNGGGGAAGEGCNLYLRHSGTITFIATLPPKDEVGALDFATVKTGFDWTVLPSTRTAEVSPNGRYVAYVNIAPTGPYAEEGEILALLAVWG
jgi:hypothetical protein